VVYTLTPHSIRGDSSLRCAGPTIDVTIWVEPSAIVILIPQIDTICSSSLTEIEITSPTGSTHPVRFSYNVLPDSPANVAITINGADTALTTGFTIADRIDNLSDTAQRVRFIVTPYIVDNNGDTRCIGENDTTTIWVEPIPTVYLLFEDDSIICNGLATSVRIKSNTKATYGVRFRYTINSYPPGTLNFSLTDTINLQKEEILNDTIFNLSNFVDTLYVVVTPYLIDPLGNPKCEGIMDSIKYEITPELILQDYAQTYTLDTINIRCFGDNNGIIFLDAIGGITAYPDTTISSLDYYFQNNLLADSTAGIYNLTAGTYSLRATDWSGCISHDTLTLYQPDRLESEFIILDSAFCEGETGKYEIVPSGGTSVESGGVTHGYQVVWIKTGVVDYPIQPPPNPLPNAPFGPYLWEVYDTNNCMVDGGYFAYSEDIDIQQFNPVHVHDTFDYGVFPISCYGESDGRLKIFVEPRSKIHDFYLLNAVGDTVDTRLSSNGTPPSFTNLPADQYTLHVYNQRGCFEEADTVLLEPDLLEITDSSILKYHGIFDASCFYSEDGRITIESVAGGREEYNYIWTDSTGTRIGSNSPVLDSVPGGKYRVMVNDNYCIDSAEFTLNAPPEITLQKNVTDLLCNSEPTGIIVIVPSGGLGFKNINWENEELSGFSVSGLSAGMYRYTVGDEVGCFVIDSSVVSEPAAISMDSIISDYNGFEVSCDDGSDGWIRVISSGGSGGHNYIWDYEGTSLPEDSSYIDSLVEGTYNIIITDTNHCEYFSSFDLDAPPQIRITMETTNQVCSVPGTLRSDVSGGIGGFELLWSNDSSGTDLNNLNEGWYFVTVTDDNGCTLIDSALIEKESSMEIDIIVIDSVRCFGSADGVLGIDTLYATPPLQVFWNDESTSNHELNDVSRGIYTVYVIDANDCFAFDTLEVTDPLPLEIETFVTDADCYDSATGAATFWTTGGNGGYFYAWDTTLIEGNAVSQQLAGSHMLQVYDSKNCEGSDEVIIGQPEQIVVYALENDIVYPDCEYAENGSIIVTVEGGTGNYSFFWPDIEGNPSSRSVENLKSDEYTVIVTDNNNCTVEKIFNLESQYESCLDIPSAFTPNGDNFNDEWIILNYAEPNVPVSERYPNMIIEVYDRYGRKVWESEPGYTHDVSSGWDGKDKQTGKILPVDSYYYFVYLNNDSKRVLQGIVTIIQ
jgi:gliding motility-associated-like protein